MDRDTTHIDALLGADGSWKEHHVLQGDGKGGFISRSAEFRFVPRFGKFKVVPFGLAKMDNGIFYCWARQRRTGQNLSKVRKRWRRSAPTAGRRGATFKRSATVARS